MRTTNFRPPDSYSGRNSYSFPIFFSWLFFPTSTDLPVTGDPDLAISGRIETDCVDVVKSVNQEEFEIVQKEDYEFQSLAEQWHEERGITSSITDMALCESYQKIIAMGKPVLPLIFRRLEAEGDDPDMWFWALRMITGTNPVAREDQGNFAAMAKVWLRWGRERYVW